MDDYNPAELSNEVIAIIVSSTYGSGDPPGNAEALMDWLSRSSSSVSGVAYAVCALGDQTYPDFCQAGVDFDRLMEERGGRRVVPRKDCDYYFEEPFGEFSEDVLSWLRSEGKTLLTGEAASVSTEAAAPAEVSPTSERAPRGTRNAPVAATLRARRRLNVGQSKKETMHYELAWSGDDVAFEPGDSFAVLPKNNATEVDAILSRLVLDGQTSVKVGSTNSSLRDALLSACDLQTVSEDLLRRFGGPPVGAAALELREYLDKRHLIDVLHDCPKASIDAQGLVEALRSLKPRLYSVANSPLIERNAVHFTVETLRYERQNRSCEGVASTWLADRVSDGSDVLMYRVAAPHFRLPATTGTPILMIGPGTGIAPFRAFLQHREAQGDPGRNWLFFGHQHKATDFLYRAELERYIQTGALTKLSLAWSRDQAHKIYVQDRVREQGAEVWSWIQSGAYIYVCGDKLAMAPQVREVFVQIGIDHGGLSLAQSEAMVAALESEGRYCADVY